MSNVVRHATLSVSVLLTRFRTKHMKKTFVIHGWALYGVLLCCTAERACRLCSRSVHISKQWLTRQVIILLCAATWNARTQNRSGVVTVDSLSLVSLLLSILFEQVTVCDRQNDTNNGKYSYEKETSSVLHCAEVESQMSHNVILKNEGIERKCFNFYYI